jgi:hypothetical protein
MDDISTGTRDAGVVRNRGGESVYGAAPSDGGTRSGRNTTKKGRYSGC